VGLGDRIRGFFSKRGNPALGELEAWVAERKGVEGFVEPQTSTNPTTLLLVDRVGEHLRAPVRDPRDAAGFCERLGIPVYDAQVIGYPQRMRDYEKRRRSSLSDDLDKDIEELERRLAESDPPPEGR
jgi:hypothetical protein